MASSSSSSRCTQDIRCTSYDYTVFTLSIALHSYHIFGMKNLPAVAA